MRHQADAQRLGAVNAFLVHLVEVHQRPAQRRDRRLLVDALPDIQVRLDLAQVDDVLLISPAALGGQLRCVLVELGQRAHGLELAICQPFAETDHLDHVIAEVAKGIVQPAAQNRQARFGFHDRQEQADAQRHTALSHQIEKRIETGGRIQIAAFWNGASMVGDHGHADTGGKRHLPLRRALDGVVAVEQHAQCPPRANGVLALFDLAIHPDRQAFGFQERLGARIDRAGPGVGHRQIHRMIGRGAIQFGEVRKTLFLELIPVNAAERREPFALHHHIGAAADDVQRRIDRESRLQLAQVHAGQQRGAQEVHVIVDDAGNHGAAVEIGLHRFAIGKFADTGTVTDRDNAVATNGNGALDGEILVHRDDLAIVKNAVGRLRHDNTG